jgi:trehalose synthase
MREVTIDPIPLDRLASLLEPDRADRLAKHAEEAQTLFDDRIVWNVNATATGGGVAEMLQSLLAYGRGAGVDTRWLVLDGNPEFFKLTKRIHNALHGKDGEGTSFSDEDKELYESVLADNLASLKEHVRPQDFVLLHDPQTAGLVDGLRETGACVVWRSHIGKDAADDVTDGAWRFLKHYVEHADGLVFTREAYVPDWVDKDRCWLIPPSLDPFSTKNADLDEEDAAAALRVAGLLEQDAAGTGSEGSLEFDRRDGSRGSVREHDDLIEQGGPIPADARVVIQVSRWDHLKDMQGVLTGFADHLAEMPDDTHLVLVGPDVSGVGDDPEGAEVLEECRALWKDLPEEAQHRVHLCVLPMDDTDENAHLVNALQRRATVVVQKSLVEGFGLTVTEPMWKARAVIASRVGGIQDQITDGESGLLLDDPRDLDTYASRLASLLNDEDQVRRLGEAARERVREQFLGDRHLVQYVDLFASVCGQVSR